MPTFSILALVLCASALSSATLVGIATSSFDPDALQTLVTLDSQTGTIIESLPLPAASIDSSVLYRLPCAPFHCRRSIRRRISSSSSPSPTALCSTSGARRFSYSTILHLMVVACWQHLHTGGATTRRLRGQSHRPRGAVCHTAPVYHSLGSSQPRRSDG